MTNYYKLIVKKKYSGIWHTLILIHKKIKGNRSKLIKMVILTQHINITKDIYHSNIYSNLKFNRTIIVLYLLKMLIYSSNNFLNTKT